MSILGSVPPATRSLAQSDLLIASLRPSLPDYSTRGTGRRGSPALGCLLGSFATAVRFRLGSICAGSVNVAAGVVLLAWVSIMYLVDR